MLPVPDDPIGRSGNGSSTCWPRNRREWRETTRYRRKPPMPPTQYFGRLTDVTDEREQVVYEMAMALANSRWVPQGLYDRAVKALGHVGITDVITLMGYYTSVSMTLAFYDVPTGAQGIAR